MGLTAAVLAVVSMAGLRPLAHPVGLSPHDGSVRPELRADVDFRQLDDLGLDSCGRNLLRNPSFEEGLKGVLHRRAPGFGPERRALGRDRFAIDRNEHVHGEASLRIRTWLGVNGPATNELTVGYVRLPVAVVGSGIYTVSFWAKGSRPTGQRLMAGISNFFAAQRPWSARYMAPSLTNEWRRFTKTFTVEMTEPIEIYICAFFRESDRASDPELARGYVWIDAVQIERGDKATDFASPPASLRLVTSSPEDFVRKGERIDARLEILTDPNARGDVRVRVRDFDGAWRFDRVLPFEADARGRATVRPDFDGANLGLGVFVVRLDYSFADGRRQVAYDRFTVLDWLANDHPQRFLFADDYGYFTHESALADARLERWKKVGYGAKCHMLVAQKSEYDHYARHGIALTDSITCLYRQGTGVGSNADSRHWRWLSSSPRDRVWNFEPDPGEILFWEPLRDPDCDGRRLTERYLRKVRDSAERLARTHPWITRWQFAGELFSTQLPKTWGVATREEAYTVFARIFKAWAEGMRAGNPSIKITHDCPWNLNPGHGLEEVDRLLKALNDEGVRVDWISAHTYRLRPEHPDLDANLTALRQVMARRGYGDAELCLPEGMHWGPYSIPAWGTTPSSWGPEPRTWHSGCLSYDMGWWEKISAAWRVRSWIIALKHGVSSSCSAGTLTFEMDSDRLTPFVTQVAPNTPGHVLGHATRFLGDFRPAPEIRIYAFDDGFDRPVAVVWCCDPCVDDGLAPPYELESDFAGTLETVIDFMNNPRAGRTRGAWRYPATSFPIYLRGLKGSSGEFLEALRTTRCVSGGVTNAASVRQDRMKVPRVKGTTPDWSAVPARALIPWGGGGTRGSAQLAWNDAGLFVRVSVCDDRLVHRVFPLGRQRNDNDTLQIGIDTCGDALQQATAGCNQDDYEYAIFPNESGPGAVTWANRVADCQMTGFFGQQGNCLIPEVPASFTRTSGGGVYEVFIPANRLLPGRLARGARMGLGLTVTDADDDALPYGRRVIGGASLGPAVASRVGRPRTWTEIEFE